MYLTPYGAGPPADMQHKALRDITAAEAYRLASPAQRRQWFGDQPPIKAGADLRPAAPVGLPPELEAAVQAHRLSHYADPICPRCRMESKDGNSRGGRCPHRPGPAEQARQLQWQRKAAATRLVQQLEGGLLGNPVRVVPVGQAAQEDGLRAELKAMIDELLS